MGDEDKKITLGGEVKVNATTTNSVPMPEDVTQNPTQGALQARALIGPKLNLFAADDKPITFSLLGGIGGDTGYLKASNGVTIGDAMNLRDNPTDIKSLETNKKFQISDNAAHLIGKISASYNQEGWVGPGFNGSLYATGTHALGNDSTLPTINTAQVGGDIGFNTPVGTRSNCRDAENYFNYGVGAQTTLFSTMPNDPRLNKVSITPFVGLSHIGTAGPTVYGKLGADYTPGIKNVGVIATLGVSF